MIPLDPRIWVLVVQYKDGFSLRMCPVALRRDAGQYVAVADDGSEHVLGDNEAYVSLEVIE